VAWNGLGERIAASLRQGDHVLVEGTLVSSTFEREVRKGRKNATVKQVSWSIRADAVRKLNRTDKEPEAIASGSTNIAAPAQQEHAESAPF
jgi:single-stranded DNA-binding protein